MKETAMCSNYNAVAARGACVAWAVTFAAVLAACSTSPAKAPPIDAAEVGEIWPGYGVLKGYLAPAELPDSLALLPAPPAEGSAAFADDRASFVELTALQPTERGRLARQDAAHAYPGSLRAFSCSLGVEISATQMPSLAMLMRRTQGDASLAPYAAKDRYNRTRPFVTMQATSCVPGDEASLATDGSYPSGHSSVGWAWALVLAEVAPERSDAILQRGRAYSQSRAICGVHWKSDIEAGRLVGAATVARLHASPAFVAQLEAARKEVVVARAKGVRPTADCASEAAALTSSMSLSP